MVILLLCVSTLTCGHAGSHAAASLRHSIGTEIEGLRRHISSVMGRLGTLALSPHPMPSIDMNVQQPFHEERLFRCGRILGSAWVFGEDMVAV